jgi:hypothetical protein
MSKCFLRALSMTLMLLILILLSGFEGRSIPLHKQESPIMARTTHVPGASQKSTLARLIGTPVIRLSSTASNYGKKSYLVFSQRVMKGMPHLLWQNNTPCSDT